MRTIIFANGEFSDVQNMRDILRPGDLTIAADGGTRHALAAGVTPHVVIGDLDSLSAGDLAQVKAGGARIIRFSPRKDETDLELALLHAARAGANEIIILAALGGRLDQTIANVLLLSLPELKELDVRIVEGAQTAFLIQGEALVKGQPGDTVSLIPLGGDAVDVTAEGLEWPLQKETLHFGPARGVSNVLTTERARVRVRQGLLLCVVTHASNQKPGFFCKRSDKNLVSLPTEGVK
ncbi:MAG: thiamine diphosphokinase [Chloroflexota bacterium]|nr:thiamine diphosphokinase [Chloroflexota bacterium]